MGMEKRFGSFTSSVDYNKLSTTVEGFIVGVSSIIIFFASLKDITVGTDQVAQFAQQAGTTIGAFGTFVGSIWTLYGLLRKVVVALTEKK